MENSMAFDELGMASKKSVHKRFELSESKRIAEDGDESKNTSKFDNSIDSNVSRHYMSDQSSPRSALPVNHYTQMMNNSADSENLSRSASVSSGRGRKKKPQEPADN